MQRSRAVIMDIDAAFSCARTSPAWGSRRSRRCTGSRKNQNRQASTGVPSLHDSDGLAIWNGSGERIWRPLNNPQRLIVSSFGDDNPRGFGLSQRDRAFDHYLDGVRYELRPTLWVEPLVPFGRGSVQLVEIPTDDEIHDNIALMWVPAEPAKKGRALEFRYRLHWSADEPFLPQLARCVATRTGNGGVPGLPRPKQTTRPPSC
jgi:glucans biosynthesis protein